MKVLGLMGSALVALTLAGCDSAGDDFDDTSDFARRLDANSDLAAAVADMPLSSASEVPDSGSATYDGYASMAIDTPSEETSLIGDARLVADFGDDDLRGRLDNFEGSVNGGRVREYDGFLTVSDGDLRVASASGIGANVGGVIQGNGDVIGVDGSVFGTFRSDDGRDVAAITAVTASGTDFTYNGEDRDGLMTIVAER